MSMPFLFNNNFIKNKVQFSDEKELGKLSSNHFLFPFSFPLPFSPLLCPSLSLRAREAETSWVTPHSWGHHLTHSCPLTVGQRKVLIVNFLTNLLT